MVHFHLPICLSTISIQKICFWTSRNLTNLAIKSLLKVLCWILKAKVLSKHKLMSLKPRKLFLSLVSINFHKVESKFRFLLHNQHTVHKLFRSKRIHLHQISSVYLINGPRPFTHMIVNINPSLTLFRRFLINRTNSGPVFNQIKLLFCLKKSF
jgi:hypothetical protein